jgi:hypothetical protein
LARDCSDSLEVVVSNRQIHLAAVFSWFIAILGSLGVRVAIAAAPLALTESGIWMMLIALPAISLIFDVRGPAPTIAEILHDTERVALASPVDVS